jgi:hypothetical protein
LKLTIFLDDESFHCLKKSIPTRSRCHSIVENHLKFGASNVVVTCDETEARNLLLYAGHCAGVAASIHKAVGLVDSPLDAETGRE